MTDLSPARPSAIVPARDGFAARFDAAWRAYGLLAVLVALILFNVIFTDRFLTLQSMRLNLTQVATVRRIIGDRLALIGCGGVDDASSARAMLDAGADLIQLYTGLIYQGPFLPALISRGLKGETERGA